MYNLNLINYITYFGLCCFQNPGNEIHFSKQISVPQNTASW